MHEISFICTIVVGLTCSSFLGAQNTVPIASTESADSVSSTLLSGRTFWLAPTAIPTPQTAPAALPSMSSELALQVYQQRVEDRTRNLASYSATSYIRVQLPATSQSGEYQLGCDYVAPRSLRFKMIYSAGDASVKTNVIARLLQSEVDYVQKDDPALTSLTSNNYMFSYKSTTTMYGRLVHIYQVKPRAKRLGLFKGRIYLDARSGTLVRAEGSIVKSPSVFIKRIHFAQNYFDVEGFTFPAHIHYEVRTRIAGTAVVDIYDSEYQPKSGPGN
jgi:outer membrane lipoprotein-sorting protein